MAVGTLVTGADDGLLVGLVVIGLDVGVEDVGVEVVGGTDAGLAVGLNVGGIVLFDEHTNVPFTVITPVSADGLVKVLLGLLQLISSA
jgi:hypothetical protein